MFVYFEIKLRINDMDILKEFYVNVRITMVRIFLSKSLFSKRPKTLKMHSKLNAVIHSISIRSSLLS